MIFVTDKPENAEYSTIYIGKTSVFAEYGNFAGLAETIDFDNQNKTDKAFVMLDSTASNEFEKFKNQSNRFLLLPKKYF